MVRSTWEEEINRKMTNHHIGIKEEKKTRKQKRKATKKPINEKDSDKGMCQKAVAQNEGPQKHIETYRALASKTGC